MKSLDSLLHAKITPPAITKDNIWRNRLTEYINKNNYKKLTVISAPTGYGKTVLLSQLASENYDSVVWYQLDEFDNDFTLFIRYLVLGISEKIDHFGMQTLNYLEKSEDTTKQIRVVATLLINELEARMSGTITLILDDFHAIKETAIHKFVEELIYHLPKNIHIIVSSRYSLPFNITRLKSHGFVTQITYEFLKFNTDETKHFFQNARYITDEKIQKYQKETGGWAVALSLIKSATLANENQKEITFKGKSNEDIYCYFAEEVFQNLSKDLQTFLIQTSVLDVVSPDICNVLTQRENSEEILKIILEKNIFIMKLDSADESYRYHHLFRDFLQQYLGNEKYTYLEKAAEYFMSKGYARQAIENYIAAANFEQAVLIIEKIGMDVMKAGNWQTVNRWIHSIPESITDNNPYFMLLKGSIYNNNRMWDEAFFELNYAIEIFSKNNDTIYLFHTQFQKAILLRRTGKMEESLKLVNETIEFVKKYPIIKWYDLVLEKVNTLLWLGALTAAVDTLKESISFARRDGYSRLIGYFMEHLGAAYYAIGDYFKAIKYYNISKEMYLQNNNFSEFEKERYSQRTTLSAIYRDWGELDHALELIKKEIETKERLGLIDDLPRAYHQLALICNDQGEQEIAEKHFQHANRLYNKLERRDFQWTWHLSLYGKILMDHGKKETGKKLIEKAISEAKNISEFNLALCEFVGCYIFIEGNEIETGLKILENSLQTAEKVGAKNLICQCCWALSNVYSFVGNQEQSRYYAGKCFTLANEGNYLQIFLSYTVTSFPAIKLGIEMGIEELFIEKIVLKLGTRAKKMLEELINSDDMLVRTRAEKLLAKIPQDKPALLKNNTESFMPSNENIQNKQLFVYCFGNFEVHGKDETKAIQWKTSKAAELFAYFIKNSDKIISKDKILEDIWPEMNPEQTSNWFHTYIYEIRSVLKKHGIPNGLIYKNKGYCLHSEQISCDVIDFEILAHQKKPQNREETIKNLTKAVQLYRGQFLEGWYNKWIIDEKRHFEMFEIMLLEKLAQIYIESKKYKLAINYYNMIIKIDPISDNINELLIKTYLKMGDRKSAISQYERYYKTLNEELNITPKKEIQDLYFRLIKNQN